MDELSAEQVIEKLSSIASQETAMEGAVDLTFHKTAVLVGTPGRYSKLAPLLAKSLDIKYYASVLDKVDLLQAMDFKEELISVGDFLKDSIAEKVIFTTNVREEKDLSMAE